MSLEIGKSYWILTDLTHRKTIGRSEWEALKYLKCIDMSHRMDDGRRYYFDGMDSNGRVVSVQEWDTEQLVFESRDEYLKYMVSHINNLNSGDYGGYEFDEYFKKLIIESQEENPEELI